MRFEWYRKSLLTKLGYPLIVLSLLSVIISYSYLSTTIKASTVESAKEMAVDLVGQYKRLRKYYTQNVISEVVKTDGIRPHYEHAGANGIVPLPATMIHELSKMMEEKNISLNLYSAFPFPNRKSRVLDAFQRESWDFLNASPKKVFSKIEEANGRTTLRVSIADTMVAQACVDCHNSHPETPRKGWSLGDVRGVLEVKTDISKPLTEAQNTAFSVATLITIITSIILIVMYFVFKHLAKKLKEFSETLAVAKKGDLSARAILSGTDEIAQLGNEFNEFLQTTEEVVANISQCSKDIGSMSKALSDSASANRQSIAMQAQETNQVAHAMKEIETTVLDVSQSAESASHSATAAVNQTKTTGDVVTQTMQSIEQLATTMQSTAETITELDSQSVEISSVIDTIRGIAEQTNLLALNAAIEAARAGEQGRGFAVVADEVRTLANGTEEATRDIQSKIEHLQSGARNSVSNMNADSAAIADTLEKAKAVVDGLAEIDNQITKLSELNINIAAASEEQSHVAQEVSHNATNLNEAIQLNEKSVGDVANTADELRALAENLLKVAGHFKAK